MTTAPGPAPPRPGRSCPPARLPRPRDARAGRPAADPAPPRPLPPRPGPPGSGPPAFRRLLALLPGLAWLAGLAGRPAARRAGALAGWLAAGALLFSCYLQISRTQPVDSDGAANALQAWDMLHGNLLLHGWRLSDVSFYTTELPEYMLVELVRGLRPDVVHVAGAITYTLIVLLAAILARGRLRGRDGMIRAAMAAGIMLAPQLGSGVYVLMLDPDHAGTAVPVLLVWLLLDRAPRRWYVPVAAAALLAWALVADGLVLIIGVLPLLTACAVRGYRAIVAGRRPLGSCWFELSLAAGALIAAAVAKGALALIAAGGGFRVWPVGSELAGYAELPRHLLLAGHGLLLLFGADFFSHDLGLVAALAMLHWLGLGLAAWAACVAIRQFAGGDLVAQILVAAVVINLAAFVSGTRAVDIHSTREIAAVLPFGAVLAARLLARRLDAARLTPALLIALTGYLACVSREMAQPAQPARGQQLADWLAAHRLDYGLAGYWQAACTTLASDGRVQVVPVQSGQETVSRGGWETNAAWYDPLRHMATFVVLPPGAPGIGYPWSFDVRAAFGQPARIYNAGPYTVLVWNRNLLAGLR
jgi:hypothetical protein